MGRHPRPLRRPRRPRGAAVGLRAALAGFVALAVAGLAAPGGVAAHPLGNFTINTYAGLRVSASEVRLDLVVDLAEIPTFEARLRLDSDEDGQLSDAEIAAAREPECAAVVPDLRLAVADAPLVLEPAGSGLSFPRGAVAGTPTMRLVCEFVAPFEGGRLPGPGAVVSFANSVHGGRLGWREIVVEGDGVELTGVDGDMSSTSISSRLTRYPEDLLAVPLDESAVAFTVTPGAASLGPLVVPEVTWRDGYAPSDGTSSEGASSDGEGASAPVSVVVPGGVASDIPEVFRAADLSPALVLLAIATALVLGAGHALTPGHGKTLMAAYLVGTRGTAIHAAGLGLSVTVSHTLGILALAVLVTGAQSALPPDLVVRALPTIAALAIVGIGAWMLVGEVRRRRAEPAGDHDHEHEHDHRRTHEHRHEHVGVRHSHGPVGTITWRSLFTLGLAGGLIPSTSALVILLGTIATGRTAFGIVLVIAFGLGMAIVLAGIGVVVIRARGWLDGTPRRSVLGRVAAVAPLVAAAAVLLIGLWLTYQGVVGGATL